MRVAVVSANLGAYDREVSWPSLLEPPGAIVDVHRFTDRNLPPRPLAMTSRLQCAIPKMWAWQILPGYTHYLWIDASCTPTPGAVSWFLAQLERTTDRTGDSAELAVFRHPDRTTIRDEVAFMQARMARHGERYLTSRYRGEWIADLWQVIASDRGFRDTALYASTAFIYRPTPSVRAMLKDWWAAKARWCLHDQIYWPYAIAKAGCRVAVIADNYLRCPALTFTRGSRESQ